MNNEYEYLLWNKIQMGPGQLFSVMLQMRNKEHESCGGSIALRGTPESLVVLLGELAHNAEHVRFAEEPDGPVLFSILQEGLYELLPNSTLFEAWGGGEADAGAGAELERRRVAGELTEDEEALVLVGMGNNEMM